MSETKIGILSHLKKAKIKIMVVTWGFNSEKLLKKNKPDYLVNSPKEILEKI